MSSISSLSHQHSITDSHSPVVVNLKFAFTMSPFRNRQPFRRLLNVTLLLNIAVFSTIVASDMMLGSLNIPMKGTIP